LLDALLNFTNLPLPVVQVAIVGIWLGIVGLISEGLYLTKSVSSEITRKIVTSVRATSFYWRGG